MDPAKAFLVVTASAALLSTACGHAYRGSCNVGGDQPPAEPAGEAQTIYIIMADQPPEGDGWVPPEAHGQNPFELTRTWVGDYDCPQGNTQLKLRILDVNGNTIKAVFDFNHVPSGAAGKYLTLGTYDEQTRSVMFKPTSWIVRPPHYQFVPMRGDVSVDGTLFAGRIMHPACGAFRLRPGG